MKLNIIIAIVIIIILIVIIGEAQDLDVFLTFFYELPFLIIGPVPIVNAAKNNQNGGK